MLTKHEARLLHALKSRSGREKNQAFVIEGVRVVEDAAAAHVDLIFAVISPSLEDSRRGQALLERLQAHTTLQRVSEAELRALSDTETPQGVIAVARTPHVSLADVKLGDQATVLVLDAVQDPGNLGTLIRSADAFAASAVIALTGTVDYWNSKVVRAAAGATFHLPLVSSADDEVWSWLEANGFELYGADMHGSAVHETRFPERAALVVGNEGSGLRQPTRARVQPIAIPMPGHAESLNVAVAAGILLYELSRANR